jgi:transcriptional regulator
MYRSPAFRGDRPEVLRTAIQAHPLALLVTAGAAGLTANLIPFTLAVNASGKDVLRAHLAKANTQLEDLRAGIEALVIFQGPQAYVTPAWYPAKQGHGKVVPTWNYVVVQAWGHAQVIDDAAWLLAQIDELTGLQEREQPQPWGVDDAPPAFYRRSVEGDCWCRDPDRSD